jgi:malonyl-CoA O-methyltransferase
VTDSISNVTPPAKKQIARAFGLKANQYDSNATIQKELLNSLLARISNTTIAGTWADLGCGIGILEKIIPRHHISGRILALDITLESLRILNADKLEMVNPIAADIDLLPFKNKCLNGIIISSVIQWFNDPGKILNDIGNTLKTHGMLIFSIFSEGSFFELYNLRSQSGLSIPINLPPKEMILSTLNRSDFKIIETETFCSTVYFPSAFELLKSISGIGGTAVSGDRFTRKKLLEFCEQYESQYRCSDGVPLTYRAILGSARKGIV